jgi:hypothetical protein
METVDVQLERLRASAEHIELELANAREAAFDCRRRMDDWLATARRRRRFMKRAAARGWWKLCGTWQLLAEEAEDAAGLEQVQAVSHDRRQDVLEVSALCLWSDLDDLKLETERRLCSNLHAHAPNDG